MLHRDGYKCACCGTKATSKKEVKFHVDKVKLNTHHIESRKTGGDAPDNLITLCEKCHKLHHTGKLDIPGAMAASPDHIESVIVELDDTPYNQIIALQRSYDYMTAYGLGIGYR